MSRAVFGAVVVSLVVHAGPVVVARSSALNGEIEQLAQLGLTNVRGANERPQSAGLVPSRSTAAIQADRQRLVERGRRERGAGELKLGDFLLDAAVLDAEELGYRVDIARARERYRANVASVITGKDDASDIVALLSSVYGDLHYQSIGGSIADALVDGGGSCEQLTHLIAATLNDAGLDDEAFVRYYGGGVRGHLVPIYRVDGVDYDLVAGEEAASGGVTFPAVDLIEVYARAHGLAARQDAPRAGASDGWSDGRATFSGGYPHNTDEFAGAVPVFAEHAVGGGVGQLASPRSEDDGADGALSCMADPRQRWRQPELAWLGIGSLEGDASVELEWREVPSASTLGYRADAIAAREATLVSRSSPSRMLMEACLALAYEDLATDLALTSHTSLSRAAMRRAVAMRARSGERFASIDWTDENLDVISDGLDSWLIAYVPGAETIVRRQVLRLLGGAAPGGAWFNAPALLRAAFHQNDDFAREMVALIETLPATSQYRIATMFALDEGLGDIAASVSPDGDFTVGIRAMRRLFNQHRYEVLRHNAADPVRLLEDNGFPASWVVTFREQLAKAKERRPK